MRRLKSAKGSEERAPMAIHYLLDTNICIYIVKHHPREVRHRLEGLALTSVAMSVVTWGELRYGAEKSWFKDQTHAVLEQLRGLIQVVDIDEQVARHYAQIRASLELQGQIIGNNDLWIAAHARTHAWTLVTNNIREFGRVPGLAVENWVG